MCFQIYSVYSTFFLTVKTLLIVLNLKNKLHLLGVDAAKGEEPLGESLEEYLDDIGDVCVVHGTVERFDEKS